MPGASTSCIPSRQPCWIRCAPYSFGGEEFECFINGSGRLAVLLLQAPKTGFRHLSRPSSEAAIEKRQRLRAAQLERLWRLLSKTSPSGRFARKIACASIFDCLPCLRSTPTNPDKFGRSLSPGAAKYVFSWNELDSLAQTVPPASPRERLRI